LPAAHGGRVSEVEENLGGLGVGSGKAEETDDYEGEKVRHKNLIQPQRAQRTQMR
jgi:hypothetical protein